MNGSGKTRFFVEGVPKVTQALRRLLALGSEAFEARAKRHLGESTDAGHKQYFELNENAITLLRECVSYWKHHS